MLPEFKSKLQELLDAAYSDYKERPVVKQWLASNFHRAREMSHNEVGQAAEDFAVWLACHYGFSAKADGGRLGDWDIIIEGKQVEVKSATLDVKGKFQFNGIKKRVDFDYLFALGIAPDNALFGFYTKPWLDKTLTTTMTKGAKDGYKLTQSPKELHELHEFPQILQETFLGNP